MKTFLIRAALLLACLFVWMTSAKTFAQSPCDRTSTVYLPGVVTGVTDSIGLPAGFTLNKKVYQAGFTVTMDFGPQYNFGNSSSLNFSGTITFNIVAHDSKGKPVSGVFNNTSYTVTLTNSNPEAALYKNFTSFADANGNFPFSTFKITITNISFTSNANTATLNQIKSSLRVGLNYTIDYGFDVASAAPPIVNQASPAGGSKEVVFSWNNGGQEFCDYQFQLVRLYNNNGGTDQNEQNITAEVDWSKALNVETESGATSVKLTAAEGTGYYAWRVRPIGTYYPGGIANPKNLNDNLWSLAPSEGQSLTLSSASNPCNCLFFLQDPDDTLNRIYSRTFTEGNRIAETSTYATGLQNVRQSQTYLPSVDTTLVIQSLQDYNGRTAVTTLPAPADSSLYKGYKKGFFNYSVSSFDSDGSYNSPSQGGGAAYNYYGGSPGVGTASGYPFKRTQFFNDGSNRVSQQSGVGKEQMIAPSRVISGTGITGNTIKTLYGTPSDEELIKLFGDEAPSNQHVFKTITIDQNNVATVTYTDKEGQVIATGLAFQDNDNTTLGALSGETGISGSMNDEITQNTKTATGFVSAKRIALAQQTPLKIGYMIKCSSLNLPCNNADVDCGFNLNVVIFNLDNNTTIPVFNKQLSNSQCQNIDSLGGSYQVVPETTITLPPGNYVVQKTLTPGTISTSITVAQNKIDLQVGPITSLVQGWLANVKCPAELNTFFNNLKSLARAVDTTRDLSGFGFSQDFLNFYNQNSNSYNITLSYFKGVPTSMLLTTPCCPNMKVPIDWTPPFNCPAQPALVDKNNNGKLDIVPYSLSANANNPNDPTEFFPDFEGYARTFLGECFDSATFYGQYMVGWAPGQFNLMVYHMLADQYNCDNNYPGLKSMKKDTLESTLDSLQAIKGAITDDCGDTIGNFTTHGVTLNGAGTPPSETITIEGKQLSVPAYPQYTCNQLVNCWINQLAALRAVICLNIGASDSTGNVAGTIDHQNDSSNVGHKADSTKEFNKQFDDNMGNTFFIIKWIAKSKVSKKMRNLQPPGQPASIQTTYNRNLVQDFLQCTGYRFAKILTQYDPYPLDADKGPSINYNVPAANTNLKANIGQSQKSTTNLDYYYMPLSDWVPIPPNITPGVTGPNSVTAKGLFPFIKNPVYAFKYFEYPYEAAATYQNLEALTCYADPNDCYLTYDTAHGQVPFQKIPCCVTINPNNGAYDFTHCVHDYNYPNIDSLLADADSTHPVTGVEIDANGKRYKLVVDNVCGMLRPTCGYTKDYWSCGQRYSFYLALKNYQIPTKDYLAVYPNRTCSEMDSVATWYQNPGSDTNNFPDLITQNEMNQLISAGLGQAVDFPVQSSFVNLQGQNVSQISYAEMTMATMQQTCQSACDSRKQALYNQLYKLLTDKCYIIGGCKTSSDYVTDNVIPDGDFLAILDSIIGQCKSICTVNTYKCVPPVQCRMIQTSKLELGDNSSIISVELGVGGTPSDACSQVTGQDYYNCSGAADSTLSFCQYTKVQQAENWNIELDIPSACPGKKGTTVFSCQPGGTTCVPRSDYQFPPGTANIPPTITSGAVPVEVTVSK